ncbi:MULTISPECIES: YbfB/YjiJ family MFS transporter [Rhodomicrobium]|uniref:YbfB/YjiJ family MFS transporter n=1 Tax=Rhodomicrobium TaxID=1068 RepID=UPI000B4BF685|nr:MULTISPECIES: YbfB/YjiJ family MFS transporter [Rhodomicrobium]
MAYNPWRLAFGGMVALAAAMGVGRFVYTPILPVMVEELGLTTSQAGLIASANFLGYLAGALLAASPAFSGSRRTYMLAGLAASALGLLAMGLTDNFTLHLIFRFIGGLASAFVLVFASALVLDQLAASGDSRLSALHFAGVGTGVVISAVAVAILVALGTGWKSLWFASALMGVAGLALAALLITPRELPGNGFSGAPAARVSFALKAMILSYGLFGFGYVITATFIVAIVRAHPELSNLEPYVWVLFGLSAAPSVALWLWLAARLGAIPAFAVACLVEAVGVASSILWASTAGLVVAMVFLGGTVMGITALGLIATRQLSTGDPRPNIALITAAFGVGQVVGPVFGGYLYDQLGSFAVPSLVAAVALVVASGLAGLAAASQSRKAAEAAASVKTSA